MLSADPPAAPPPKDAGARWLRWLPLAIVLGVFAYHVAPMWRNPHTWAAWWDCRYFFFVVEVDYTTITQYHQLPLWNPYYCGGAPQLANAQAATLSPLTLLVTLLGMPLGYRAGYTAGLLTALLGMRAYARSLGLSQVASALAGAGFGLCGAFAMHLGGGHWSWLGFALFPLVLRSLRLAAEGRRAHYVWGAVCFAIVVFHAPVYPLAYAIIVVGVYALFEGLGRDRARLARALIAASTTIVLGFLLAAVRVFPLWEHVSHHPRPVKDWDYTWPWELFITYGWRWTERGFGHHQYVYPELGNYFGLPGLALVLAGLFVVVLVARRRRALWPLVAATFVFVLFQLGNLVPLPWWLVKHLPVYEHLRVPSRFTIVVGIFFCAFLGVAVDEWGAPGLSRWRDLSPRRRWAAAGVLALAAAYLVDVASFSRREFVPTFGWPAPAGPPAAQFHQVAGDRLRMQDFPARNLGTLSCYEETPVPISPRLRGDLPADEYLADPGAGTVTRKMWSPNRIELEVDAKRPTTVLVNQNFGDGWRADGAELVPGGVDGLIGARVAAGRHTVVFRYLPRAFVAGAVVSLLAAAGAVAFLLLERRAREFGRAPARG